MITATLDYWTAQIFFGNSVQAYLVALVVFVVATVAFAVLQRLVIRRLETLSKRTKNNIDDAVVAMVKSVRPHFYWFIALYLGLATITLPAWITKWLSIMLMVWVLYQAVRAGTIAIEILLAKRGAKESEKAARQMLVSVAKWALWVTAIMLLLSNLGVNITSLIAGLGIGGVAIAFALQNILSDLFSSFAIYFDKPFEVGDLIVVGDIIGTVDRIGIKTTRLTALRGEEVVIANRELTSTSIQNFKKMQERRIETKFGITYEVPRATVASLSKRVQKALEAIDGIRVDRVHLSGFGESAIEYTLVYYIASPNYMTYMDLQQEINLALLELFEKEKVSFAYPTRVIYTNPSS